MSFATKVQHKREKDERYKYRAAQENDKPAKANHEASPHLHNLVGPLGPDRIKRDAHEYRIHDLPSTQRICIREGRRRNKDSAKPDRLRASTRSTLGCDSYNP